MLRMSSGRFIVAENEEVTVTIIAVATGNTATFVVDTPSRRVSDNPITHVFDVTKRPGQTHFGEVRGAFHGPPPNDPNSDPRFETFLTGSFGGVDLPGPIIRRSDPDHICDITFELPEED